MAIDNRARDLALGLAAALQAGENLEPTKLAIVRYLMEPAEAQARAERLLDNVNANAVLVGSLLEAAPRWYQVGWTRGHAFGGS